MIRTPTPEDALAIATVHVRSWQAVYRGHFPADFLDALEPEHRVPRWARAVERRPEGLLVVEDRGRVVGFASFGAARHDDAAADLGELMAIYLLPRAFGRGLGRALLAEVERRLLAQGFRAACLWVLDGNARARRFYAAAGWRPDGAVKIEHVDGQPARELRYVKQLHA